MSDFYRINVQVVSHGKGAKLRLWLADACRKISGISHVCMRPESVFQNGLLNACPKNNPNPVRVYVGTKRRAECNDKVHRFLSLASDEGSVKKSQKNKASTHPFLQPFLEE